MHNLRIYFAAFALILISASFSFAGEVQCPFAPPPPPEEGRISAQAMIADSIDNAYPLLSEIWEFIAQSTDLF
jgi:hypothetical protein